MQGSQYCRPLFCHFTAIHVNDLCDSSRHYFASEARKRFLERPIIPSFTPECESKDMTEDVRGVTSFGLQEVRYSIKLISTIFPGVCSNRRPTSHPNLFANIFLLFRFNRWLLRSSWPWRRKPSGWRGRRWRRPISVWAAAWRPRQIPEQILQYSGCLKPPSSLGAD